MSYLDRDHRPTGADIGHQILASEGIEIHRFPPGMQKSKGLVDASLALFGFILPDGDARWQVAYGYQKNVTESGLSQFNFESAMRAIYLGSAPSRINGYRSSVTDENLRQLCRAIQNLGANRDVSERFQRTRFVNPGGSSVLLTFTDRLSRGSNPDGTTACPEALYQIRLSMHGRYLGRVGFNIHTPAGDGIKRSVLSITNVQGAKDSAEGMRDFRQRSGQHPLNFLAGMVKDMYQNPDFPQTEVLGIANPWSPIGYVNPDLYHSVFTRTGIKKVPFERPDPNSPASRQAELAVLFQHRRPMPNGHQERGN